MLGLDNENHACVAELQAERRLPSVAVVSSAGGDLLTSVGLGHVGQVTDSAPPDGNTQYRIASITKTFTATLVLGLAAEGQITLNDRVELHLPGNDLGRATLAQLLSHAGGIQREPATPMWQTFVGPDEAELVASLPKAEMVAEPGERWHYSNLGYAILGLIVHQATGKTCETLINERFIEPLSLGRTTWQAVAPAATGYRVDPYQDVLHEEPDMQQRAAGMGGQMWSTSNDLIEWAQALMGRRPDVLAPDLVDEMHAVRILVDQADPNRGWGYGLSHLQTGDRTWSGHTGAVPGFGSALIFDRGSGIAVAALTNTMDALSMNELALDLAELAISGDGVGLDAPAEEHELWRPSPPCPPEIEGLLGPWWFEGGETLFRWMDDCLQVEIRNRSGSESMLTQIGPDRFRTTDGREKGELLVVHRDKAGEVEWFEWATYPYVRHPNR